MKTRIPLEPEGWTSMVLTKWAIFLKESDVSLPMMAVWPRKALPSKVSLEEACWCVCVCVQMGG